MPTLLHPGVYVSEVPSGARSIEGAPTSTTIFVGETERGPRAPTKIKSRTDYERYFGGYYRMRDPGTDPTKVLTAYAMDGFYLNGGSTAYVLRAIAAAAATANNALVEASSPGLWGNSVSVAILEASGNDDERFQIAVVYASPENGEQRLVERWDRLSIDPADENYVVDILERSLFIRWRPDVEPTVPVPDLVTSPPDRDPEESAIIGAAAALANGSGGGNTLSSGQYSTLLADGLAGVDDAALLVNTCDVMLDEDGEHVPLINAFIGFAAGRPRQDLFFVGDLPPQRGVDATAATEATVDVKREELNASNFAALNFPYAVASDVVGVGRNPTITVPTSGYVAGLFARTDGRRGVWKAPAGTEATLNATLALEHELNDLHSDELNPQGINALRQIPGAGRVVWGARTMEPASEWRYIPVRRTAIYLRTSIYNGIQWAVFEPNGEALWASLRTSIGSFMEIQFRNGAFAGRTSDEAYLVKVDAETTTEIDQAAGIVNILVGFAPLRPAEFVVVKLSQKTQATA